MNTLLTSNSLHYHSQMFREVLKKTVEFVECKSDVESLAIGIGHDVSRYYSKAIKITDIHELGDVMISQLSGLFEDKSKLH